MPQFGADATFPANRRDVHHGLKTLAVTMQLDAPFPLTPALSPRRGRTIWQRNQGHRLVSFPTRSKRLPLLGERAGVRGNARFEVHGYGLGSLGPGEKQVINR